MTERETVERGERAKRALEEFITPEFAHARQTYMRRMVEVAAQELHPGTRADKITTLSMAVRVLDEIENSIAMVCREGEHAREQMIRAERIENLTDAQQRLLRIAPQL